MKTLKLITTLLLSFTILLIGEQNQELDVLAAKDSLHLSKKGGLCFRFDDNSKIADYLKVADIFNKYNANFCISLNFNDFKTPEYKDSIKELQEMGNEIMDHTPNHRTNYFTSEFPISDYYSSGSNNFIPGVDHINNDKICLEFQNVDTNLAIQSGTCFLSSKKATGDFTSFTGDELYIFFPQIDKLALISNVDNNSLEFVDVWENPITLSTINNAKYFTFSKSDVKLTKDAITVLGNESLKLADELGIERPKVWIQPGGNFPQLSKYDLKEVLGDKLYYIAGSVSTNGRKVYNEYDPDGVEKYEMQWGDFFDDEWSLEKCKNVISDRLAKHYVLINHAHLYDIDSLDQYLEKLDSLLAWASSNNIPIKTYSEWADILYNREPKSDINIFPSLNVDLDKNVSELDTYGVPDGFAPRYWYGQGNLAIDTITNDLPQYCYRIDRESRICRVDNLAGIEKGNNDFRIKTRGAEGDSIEVIFSFTENPELTDKVFKFPADTRDWTEYSLENSRNGNTELNIAENVTFVSVDIICSDYLSGNVEIKDIYLAPSLISSSGKTNTLVNDNCGLDQNYPNPFNPETKITYSLNQKGLVSIKVYDILGREIITLVNATQDTGTYEINFDGSNLSSGIYIYSLKTNNYFQSKKMILMK